jgi:DNA helicase HerA-like ATPase
VNDGITFNELRGLTIGTVEFISPKEIRILLELNAPQNTALNTGVPTLFPKINGYVLIPNEAGAVVAIISWIGVENSPYPKRKGFKDFDLVDLPFPLRKMSVSPLGILKKRDSRYEVERGVYSYPSVGDPVVIPTYEQLEAIVQNKSPNAKVKIGTSPLAANTPVFIDPDRLFGRHVAVLGNTGSGKSCSVAGLIRWSLEAARNNKVSNEKNVNARFLILDPNGEYTNTFDSSDPTASLVRKFKVKFEEGESVDQEEQITSFQQFRVPAWMWNSYEWSSITQASGETQRPVLRRALRELRNGNLDSDEDTSSSIRRYYSSCLMEISKDYKIGATAYKGKPGKNEFGKKLQSIADDFRNDSIKYQSDIQLSTKLETLADMLDGIADKKHRIFTNSAGENVDYYNDFEKAEVEQAIKFLDDFLKELGGALVYKGPDEDSPVYFNGNDLPNHLERLSQELSVQQFLDLLIMRIRTMLADTRMSSVINTDQDITLIKWLEDYIGMNEAQNGEIGVIDLSIVPADILHIVVAVVSRMVFEALQRYRRKNNQLLPTVLVMEEAHNFISRYNDNEELTPSRLCSQTFEKIAKEGRKFGLGLMLSSQRPAELSPTVISQCNTFLLHRIVNDRDQELVRKFVPDNLGTILNELPSLPTKKAILLGWAAPIPILVDMNELRKEERPDSKDPSFWDVWTGKENRLIDWKLITEEWQQFSENMQVDSKSENSLAEDSQESGL